MKVRAHILVSGLVQGVGFRYFVYDRAVSYAIAGYVRNLFSGEVEVEAEGERSLIEELIKDIKVGPRAARVRDIKIEWIKCTNYSSNFEVR